MANDTTQVNKFTKNLSQSHKDIRGKKAQLIADDAKDAQENLVRTLKQEYRDLERTLVNLDDIYPENVTSLSVTKLGFDAKEWVKEMHENKLALALKKVEVDTAEDTLREYFGE